MTVRHLVVITFLLGSSLLTSCVQHWSEQQCRLTNLQTQGVVDGRNGKPQGQFVNYATDCSKFQITLNANQYYAGWRQGNAEFCQPANLFQQGKAGNGYPAVCPNTSSRVTPFNRGMDIHNEIVELQNEINEIDNTLYPSNDAQAAYNDTLNKITQDKNDLNFAKQPGFTYYGDAQTDLEEQQERLKVERAQMIANQVRSVASIASGERSRLLRRKQQLQQRINHLQSINYQ